MRAQSLWTQLQLARRVLNAQFSSTPFRISVLACESANPKASAPPKPKRISRGKAARRTRQHNKLHLCMLSFIAAMPQMMSSSSLLEAQERAGRM